MDLTNTNAARVLDLGSFVHLAGLPS